MHRAIVWQDRRTAERCAALREAGHEPMVTERTGLLLDPYFSGTKAAWILDHVEGARARAELSDLPLRAPAIPMVGGDAQLWRGWSSPAALFDYTLGAQVDAPYDFSAAVQTALGEYAPDAVICLGPGDTMGAPVAQAMIEMGWRGLRDRADFLDAQAESPLVISMARPEQRALAARS